MILRLSSSTGNSVLRGLTARAIITAYEPETLDWAARVQAQGGSVLLAIDAVDTYIKGCKAAGLLPVMTNGGMILVFATDSFAGLFVPLIAPAGVVPTNVNFVSGDYALNTGLNPGLGNTTKHLNTNYSAARLSLTSAQASVYVRQERDVGINNGGNGAFLLGSQVDGSNRFSLIVKLGGSSFFDCWNSTNGSGRLTVGSALSLGLISGIRSSASESRIYRNGASTGLLSATGGSIPDRNIFIWAMNNNNAGAIIHDDRIVSYAYIGPALTAAQEALHAPLVEALQDSLGRGVI